MSLPYRLRLLLLASVAALSFGGAAQAADADATSDSDRTVSELVVTGEKHPLIGAASGLPLSIQDTPQQITVVGAQQIRDFGLTDINALLNQAPGINVEQTETDRTQYDARGFAVTNLQMDGVGLPLISGIQFGSYDTALFDHVEVISGANALMTGIGNPSATVNYIRKRPTATLQGDVAAEVGSWDHYRLEGDISGTLNASGTLRARLVAAGERENSYLDFYRQKRGLVYGVAAWDATPNLTLTAGYSRDDNRSKGVLWGALPLDYSDGSAIDYPVSASTSAPWTYWNVLDQTAFLEAAYSLPGNWTLKGTGTYRDLSEHAKLLYGYGNPDPVTGLGVGGMSGIYPSFYRQYMLDLAASGPFQAFGREHQLAVGFSAARSVGHEYEAFSSDSLDYPSIFQWGSQLVAEPSYPDPVLQSDTVDRMVRGYVSSRLNLSDRLKAVVGATAVRLNSTGTSYGVDQARSESKFSPYAGLIYQVSEALSLYASYTDIFNPQIEADINHVRLAAAHGLSYEAGFKANLADKRLYVTGAVFHAVQDGLAEQVGVDVNGNAYYAGINTKVTGVEGSVAGQVTDRWTLDGGVTILKVDGADDIARRPYIPRRVLKVSSTYSFPQWRDLKVGGAIRWQSATSALDSSTAATITQASYVVLDLTASINVNDKVRATLNIRNVADDKHYNSLAWGQAFYAEPRNAAVRLDYAF